MVTPSLLAHQFQAELSRRSRSVASIIERIGFDCLINLMLAIISLAAPSSGPTHKLTGKQKSCLNRSSIISEAADAQIRLSGDIA